MAALTPGHLLLIVVAFLLLFGYKKLPDASRSLGRSLRIFKGEMRGMAQDAEPTTGEGDQGALTGTAHPGAALPARPDPETLEAQAQAAEALAMQLRARAAGHGDTSATAR